MCPLIVEDQPDLPRSLAGALREDGHAVDKACDGEDGITKALQRDHYAIVVNVMLPGMSGFAVSAYRHQSAGKEPQTDLLCGNALR
jgi:DNA-binding response OmpR family regulator